MSISADLTRLIAGLFLGIVLPRIPLLFFTRFLNLERELPPHPDPIPIEIHQIFAGSIHCIEKGNASVIFMAGISRLYREYA